MAKVNSICQILEVLFRTLQVGNRTSDLLLFLLDCCVDGHKNDLLVVSHCTRSVWTEGSLLSEVSVDVVSVVPSSFQGFPSNSEGFH